MKRTAGTLLLLATLGGCASQEHGPDVAPWAGGGPQAASGGCPTNVAPPVVPGMVGPHGQPVTMMAPPAGAIQSGGAEAARAMFERSLPPDIAQAVAYSAQGAGSSGIMQAGGPPGFMPSPPGMAPPAMPLPGLPPGRPAPGVVAGVGLLTGAPNSPFPCSRTEVRFAGPSGMKITWFAPGPDGKNTFAGAPIEAPGRYNFVQAAIYRLKLSDIPNHPGLELYPTLEVVPANAKTAAFMAHSAVPLSFTEEDFDQVTSGNYVVKVIYLPDPQFQDLATVGPDEVVSSRLEPGVDPIAQAHSRGSILLVVRLGNIDLEAPNTPAMDAPSPYQPRVPVPPMMPPGPGGYGPGAGRSGPMVPYGMGGPGSPNMGPGGPMMGQQGPGLQGSVFGPQGAAIGAQGPAGQPGPGAAGSSLPAPPNGFLLPPAQGAQPSQPATSGAPVSRSPDASKVQQAQYRPTASSSTTAAGLAGQGASQR